MNRHINHATVLGSGVMGAGIACHLANIGVEVLMLDITPKELNDKEKSKGLSLDNKLVRNRIAQSNLDFALKSKPSPIYHKKFASRIEVGNFDDDFEKVGKSDWIIEVVVERLDIKKIIFEKVEKYRKEGSLVTSNTSGIPIQLMSEGRSEDFQKNFCGTHFFNPPRYLRLFEIIPGPKTDTEVLSFFNNYADLFLGKKPVMCKDTPGFIGNRVGVYSMSYTQQITQELGLKIEEVDSLTGTILDRPKTGTFKLGDLVGLDTAANVARGLKENAKEDEMIQSLKEPEFMKFLLDNKFLGNKTKKGFYFKEKGEGGKTQRFALDLDALEYRPMEKAKLDIVGKAKGKEKLSDRLGILLSGDDKYSDFLRKHFAGLFSFVSLRVPEISDNIYSVDDAMVTGYAWGVGPFSYWDAVGLEKGIEITEAEGFEISDWVKEMAASGKESFFTFSDEGKKSYYDLNSKSYVEIPGQDATINLDYIRGSKTVWKNSECNVIDLGDGVLNVEFNSKMNSLGKEVMEGLVKGIELAEESHRGVVISNQGENFSVGANLFMMAMMAGQQQWKELDELVKEFQDAIMRIRYSDVPVISAPHNMALGGGCEVNLHADRVVASAETYIGLVEVGVGLIPAGGGTKELTFRTMDGLIKDDVKLNRLREAFFTIGQAKVATSAYEAKDLGIIRDTDVVVVNRERLVQTAKKHAILMAESGYTRPVMKKVRVLGKQAMGMVYVGTDSMVSGDFISDHDRVIANKIGYVMTGGNLSEPTEVSEQYLLDLEREVFVDLLKEQKTIDRIQHMLTTGRPLRN